MQIVDKESAEILGIEKGKFYCFFKPSFANHNAGEIFKLNKMLQGDEEKVTNVI